MRSSTTDASQRSPRNVRAFEEDVAGCTADVVVDLGRAHVVPGFNDAHHHLSLVGKKLRELDVSHTAAPSLEALYQAVAARAETLPADAWVVGSGDDQNKIGEHPTAEGLDPAAGGRPV